jgi:hypothetical protein
VRPGRVDRGVAPKQGISLPSTAPRSLYAFAVGVVKAVVFAAVAGGAIAGSFVTGAASALMEAIHPSHPKIEVVPGSFGSTDQAKSIYLKESSANVVQATQEPAASK